jgi:hypothetical protein
MTDEGKRYVGLAAVLKDLEADEPRYYEVVDEMDQIWRRLSEPERDEINGLLIAIDEVERTGEGYPPANPAADNE